MAITQRSGRRSQKSYGKRKRPFNYPKIIALVIALITVLILMVLGIRGLMKKTEIQETIPSESEELRVTGNITVNGVLIQDKTKEEAREAILDDMQWDLEITYKEDTHKIENVFEATVDEILEEIYPDAVSTAQAEYDLKFEKVEEALQTRISEFAPDWDIEAKNAGISSYDAASKKFIFTAEEAGMVINREKLLEDIKSAVKSKEYTGSILAEGMESQPSLTEAMAREQYKIIGTFSTKVTSNKDRNQNILLASEAINGKVIPRGGIFSINDSTGERSLEKGYKPAGAYVNGILVEEPGGGVCQVSSTLYNSVILAGLNTTERYSHSYEPAYVIPGEDAMISFPGLDMKFENDSIASVGILASLEGNQLKISVYGIPVLEEGVTRKMHTEAKDSAPLEPPVYENDPTLAKGEEVVVKEGVPGRKYVTYLITLKNGQETERILLHNSSYKGKPAKIRRNTDPNAPLPTELNQETEIQSENGNEITSSKPAETEGTKPAETASVTTPHTELSEEGPWSETAE